MDNTFGLQFRNDEIMGLGLDNTFDRQYLSTISLNNVSETNADVYFKNQSYWLEKFRTVAGLRVILSIWMSPRLDNTTHNPLNQCG